MKSINARFIKRTFFLILIIHFSTLSYATTYYVSNTGNDSNSGLTIDLSWKTLNKVNAATFASGDQILFKRGDTFLGSLTVQRSGISYGAYGTGNNPIISGFETLTGWVDQGGGIYRASTTADDSCRVVTINGVNTPMGRYPNTSYLTFESSVGRTSITDNQLTNTPNWTGAEIVIKVNNWTLERSLITNHTNNTITYTAGSPGNTAFEASTGYLYFIQHDIKTLDTFGEWYCDGTYMYMYFGATNPSSYIVKASVIDNVISIPSRNSTTINDLAIEGGNRTGVFFDLCTGMYINRCSIKYNGYSGIYGIRSVTSTIDNCDVSDNSGFGVKINCTSATLKNSTIDSNGIYAGMGNYDGTGHTGVDIRSTGGLIEYNKISNAGYNGINYYNNNFIVRYNEVYNTNDLILDGAAIYTYVGDPSIISSGQKVYNNIVHDCGANGLYFDNSTNNLEAYNNVVINVGNKGFHCNDVFNLSIHDNTFYNCTVAAMSFQNTYYMNGYCHDNSIYNNTVVQKTNTQFITNLRDLHADGIINLGSLSNNNFVIQSLSDNLFSRMHVQPSYSMDYYTFANWKTYTGQEVNSTLMTTNLSDIIVPYNNAKIANLVSLTTPMIDVKGTKYTTTITLQPYTSIVLMKDNSSLTAPGSPTSVVATAGNASATVNFAASANDGGSAVTGYTVTSIPSGGIDSNAGSTSLTHTVTGLTNGTSYTFTVKATNSFGSSVSSVSSNSVIPKAPVATGFQFNGPSSGTVNNASTNFSITPNDIFTGTITITPSGVGSTGISPIVLTFSNSSTAQTFAITPTVAGSITLTATNSGTLTNPTNLIYTVNAVVPDAPTLVIATASGNTTATITFTAPANNGGSAITGYTVTSSPAGGTDTNAGSVTLTHLITGLANDISYTFTVTATNSAGNSIASVVSNPVILTSAYLKQGEILPTHFIPVWQGQNGLNHMNVMVISATLNDLPITTNDEVAIFSGNKCVGSQKLGTTLLANDNSTYLNIIASQDDGSGNGFVDQDTILFKIWDDLNQREMVVQGITYRTDVSTWLTTGKFVPGGTAVVEIISYTEYTQTIQLLKGYNMISTTVMASNPDVSVVTEPLCKENELIKVQDESGNSFENWGTFGGWVNNLGSIQKTEGYKIKVTNDCSFQVIGRLVALPLDIPLKTGWNMIPFPCQAPVDAMSVIQSLIDQHKLVKVQDEEGNSIEDWGVFGGWKNGIGNFIPGKAYKVKVLSDITLTIQENYLKSAIIIASTPKTEYFSTSFDGHGTDHMNLNLVNLKETGLSVGDELGAFDGSICVGSKKLTENDLIQNTASLVASFSTDDQNMNGFKSGDLIRIYSWKQSSGQENEMQMEAVNGQMSYEKNGTTLLRIKSLVTTAKIGLNELTSIDVFPNPSKGKVTVRFSEIPDANSRIDILDLSGRLILSRMVSGTSEEFSLDSQPAGLYLIKTVVGIAETIHKLVIKR